MTPVDAEIDLCWYYQSSASRAGLRSPLGAQLDMLREGILPGRRVVLSDDEAVERFDESTRLLRISRRLRNLTTRERTVLEAQFQSAIPGTGHVSMGLAMETRSAKRGFALAARAARRKGKTVTPSGWFLWLQDQNNAASTELLETILIEARTELDYSILAYLYAGEDDALEARPGS